MVNMIIGGRGIGKSYGAKKMVIKNFLKRGEEFIYLRRYKQELQKTSRTFWNDIKANEEFSSHELGFKSNQFTCDGKTVGYAISLNTSLIQKGISYPNVTTIIFDEFLIDSPVYRYLNNEVLLFLDLLESIFRTRRNVKVFMLANSVSFVNPYFRFWGIERLNKEFNMIKERNILVVLPEVEEFRDFKKTTSLYKLYQGTDYEDYNINNEFQDLQDKRFIEPLNNHCKYYFTIVHQKKEYGVYKDYQENKLIFSEKVNKTCPIKIALTYDDMNPNSILAKSNNLYLKNLRMYFYYSMIYFDNEKTQSELQKLIDFMC